MRGVCARITDPLPLHAIILGSSITKTKAALAFAICEHGNVGFSGHLSAEIDSESS